MIVQKQVGILVHDKIFSFSPNLRLEREEKAQSGRHLIDFVQLDLEVKNAKREDIMSLMEDLIIFVINNLLQGHSELIKKVSSWTHCSKKKPFNRISVKEAKKKVW